ncbi:MAG: response regulator transcription factor [Saprospiraceae bacterium]|nr:response regulator transcription factor [Saprospiraceae bacterium]|tara:strand:- start:1005 stop:1649 length:645 start_codon:yes stop_codon:yes gene_type:complete
MKKHTVIIADPEFLSRQGLKAMISSKPFYEVVGEAKRHEELEMLLQRESPDLIIIDYNQHGYFGIETISMISDLSPTTNIVVVSDDDDKRSIYEVLERGISNYVTKKCEEHEIQMAIDSALKSQKFYCSKILDIIISKSFGNNPKDGTIDHLTERERDVLTQFASGKLAKEISSELNVSIHTVYTHRKNIMKKLKLNSPVQLVMFAVNNGLVEF